MTFECKSQSDGNRLFVCRENTLTGKWVIERSDGRHVASYHEEHVAKAVTNAMNKGLIPMTEKKDV
jgi:formaldehyde-activating enzyme involved in methanogenesis